MEVDISNAEYHADTARPSKSMLSTLLDRPSTYYKRYLAPHEERQAYKNAKHLVLGDAVHCKVLEPDEFWNRYHLVQTQSRVTKAFRESQFLHPLLTCLTIPEYDMICQMAEALWNDKHARIYLELSGKAERTFYYTDPKTGIELKARPDYISDNSTYILDIKTCRSINPFYFTRDCDEYKYWLSPEIINNAVESVRGKRPEAYVFLCVENRGEKSPDTAIYYADIDFLEMGERKLKEALSTLKFCRERNEWPANKGAPMPVGLTSYRKRELERIREHQANTFLDEVHHAS